MVGRTELVLFLTEERKEHVMFVQHDWHMIQVGEEGDVLDGAEDTDVDTAADMDVDVWV